MTAQHTAQHILPAEPIPDLLKGLELSTGGKSLY